ncbi:MAG TPA: lytic transglycosylase domain-containing protein [Blastocatellia bacterium]|nr:lytic transglycosylase domain-containing protein [Blastocatellia bacterium]
MKNYAVPEPLTGIVSRSRARVFITLIALLVIGAFVLTRQTHATAPTLGEAETQAQGMGQPSSEAVEPNEAAKPNEAAEPNDASKPAESPIKSSRKAGRVTSGNRMIDDVVKASSARHGVDPKLVFAVMRKESRFNPRARSGKNAMGLMQIVPATAHRFHKSNPLDIGQNVDCGVQYLRFLLEKFSGDVRLALAGYNAGENAVVHCGYRVPNIRETKNYVNTIVADYGQTHHPILDPDEASQVFQSE